MSRLKTSVAGLELKNPVLTASGTFGSGLEFEPYFDISRLGGVIVKGTTLNPQNGNPRGRVLETPAGLLNCIGLQNPGAAALIRDTLPEFSRYDTRFLVNISGNTVEEYGMLAEMLDRPEVDALEVNISCPNVKSGGLAFGTVPEDARAVTREVRRRTSKPVIVKLSPNVTDIAEIARAVEDGGAHGVSLINTLLGMAIDVEGRKPALSNVFAGLSGPAVKPVGLRMVWQVYRAVNIPVIGLGGIMNGQDALEYIMAGASAIQVGTASLIDPGAALRVVEELEAWCIKNNVQDISELVGAAHRQTGGRK